MRRRTLTFLILIFAAIILYFDLINEWGLVDILSAYFTLVIILVFFFGILGSLMRRR